MVTIRLIGALAPGIAREMSIELSDAATVRDLIGEAGRLGGEPLRRALWRSDGRLDESVMIAVDGDVMDREQLDARLPVTGDAAEVSLFLIRPIFGGATDACPRALGRVGEGQPG